MTVGQRFGAAAGTAYLLIGLFGFVVTGFGDFASPRGETLIILGLNPLHNVFHLALGIVWLAAAPMANLAKSVNRIFGAILLFLGIAGFFVLNSNFNILALSMGDGIVHIVSGGLAAYFGFYEKDAAA